MPLTVENYTRGFLLDEELMAGISQNPEQPEHFVAYVVRHTTGEYLGHQPCPTLDEALTLINQIPRPWKFETSSGCEGTKCGEGKCKGGSCKSY